MIEEKMYKREMELEHNLVKYTFSGKQRRPQVRVKFIPFGPLHFENVFFTPFCVILCRRIEKKAGVMLMLLASYCHIIVHILIHCLSTMQRRCLLYGRNRFALLFGTRNLKLLLICVSFF